MTLLEDLERAANICIGVRAWMSGPESQDMAAVGYRLRAHATRLREEIRRAEQEASHGMLTALQQCERINAGEPWPAEIA